jgi:hypothetical protein
MVQKSLNLKWFLSLKIQFFKKNMIGFLSFGELYVLETWKDLFEKLYLL